MQKKLKDLLNKHNIKLVELPKFEAGGCLMVYRNVNYIFVDGRLSPDEQEHIIWHELGHKMHDHEVVGIKHKDFRADFEREFNADEVMLRQMSELYASSTLKENANYVDFAKSIGMNDSQRAKKALDKEYDNRLL